MTWHDYEAGLELRIEDLHGVIRLAILTRIASSIMLPEN
jgi:hypothetical protein